jgi:hypothetical protein
MAVNLSSIAEYFTTIALLVYIFSFLDSVKDIQIVTMFPQAA